MSLRRRRSSREAASAKRNQGSIGRTAQLIRSRVQPSRRRRAPLAAIKSAQKKAAFNKRKKDMKDAIDKGPSIDLPHMRLGRKRKSKLASEKSINARNKLSSKKRMERATGTTSVPKGVKNIGLKSAERIANNPSSTKRKTRTPKAPIRKMPIGPRRRTSGFGRRR